MIYIKVFDNGRINCNNDIETPKIFFIFKSIGGIANQTLYLYPHLEY